MEDVYIEWLEDEKAFSLNNPGGKVHHGDKCIQNKSLETNEGEKSASDSDAEGNLLSNDKADYVMVSASTFLLFNVDCYFLFFCRSAANSVMSMSECLTCQDI